MEKKKPGLRQPNPEKLARFHEAWIETGLNAYQVALRIRMKPSSARANALLSRHSSTEPLAPDDVGV